MTVSKLHQWENSLTTMQPQRVQDNTQDCGRAGTRGRGDCPERRGRGNSIRLFSVITRPRAGQQVRPVADLDLDPAPRAVALLVRRLVAEAVDLAQVFDDLVVNAAQV